VKLTTRTGIDIRRTLPHRYLRTIGAWCFIDHYGPTSQEDAMSVGAHPHVGLQTVSWLFEGEVEHRDSLGSVQVIHPGELNLMTSGRGIAHSELSVDAAQQMHGVQLWIVLPENARNDLPSFDQYQDLPTFTADQLTVKLIIGEFMDHHSPAKTFSELLGAEINLSANCQTTIQLNPNFEYGALLVQGDISIDSESIPLTHLYYLPIGGTSLSLTSTTGAKIILLGGPPFPEEIVMWWNFIGRSHDEIVQMRTDWNNQSARFPAFTDQIQNRIPAPELPNLRLTPRGNVSHKIT
jgi:redox-sensitive bicupin YhaK (pirin superfamily)